MPRQARQHPSDESGFTMPELLVVILIIGILAAIGLAVLLTQTHKAQDTAAKAQVRNAQTTVETYATDHNGEYKGVELATLKASEPTLGDEGSAKLLRAEAKGSGFLVQSEAVATKNKYSIERQDNGEVSRSCEKEKTGGCPEGGKW